MRYFSLATDYDGTLATDGVVTPETIKALERFRKTGRRLILVTGRELEELEAVFPRLDLFDRVVAENGGLLYRPADRTEQALGEHPPQSFLAALRKRSVKPLSVGRVVVATRDSQQAKVLEAIHAAGLELQVIFNKGSVMVLPPGVNKATGLETALLELGLSRHNTIGVGDAENDHAFLACCELAVAVANALPALKERADLVTSHSEGAGVVELMEQVVESDLAQGPPKLARHDVPMGTTEDGREVRLPAYGVNVMVAGSSGGGKSTLTTGIMERLLDAGYQLCVIDPEGDYQALADTVMLGTAQNGPTQEEIGKILDNPHRSAVLNLIGIPHEQRPAFFQSVLARLQEHRTRTGLPHWIVVDEAHHVLPADWPSPPLVIPEDLKNLLMITVMPDHMQPAAVSRVDMLLAVGKQPDETYRSFEKTTGRSLPSVDGTELKRGEVLFWSRYAATAPIRFSASPCRTEAPRHSRKYATGEVAPDQFFYFRGPQNQLNLRVQNLMTFLQTADGVDEKTWLFHLQRGEYSRWFRSAIHSDDLAAEVEAVEREPGISAAESRARVRAAVEQRFTIPA